MYFLNPLSHLFVGKKAARAVLSVGAAYVEENSAAAGPTVSPMSIRKRITNKPSIQLDVLSADRLMPAKKVGINFSTNDFGCLKVFQN